VVWSSFELFGRLSHAPSFLEQQTLPERIEI
jgi:hypothetical protein